MDLAAFNVNFNTAQVDLPSRPDHKSIGTPGYDDNIMAAPNFTNQNTAVICHTV